MDDDFDTIENYNPEDETINFGTRIISVGQDLHELVTLCTLRCSTMKYYDFPEMEHIVHDGKFYMSIKKSLRIFSDIHCKSLDWSAKFNYIIDGFNIQSNYMLIYLRNGTIHLWDKNVMNIVFTCSVIKNIDFNDKYFIKSFNYGDADTKKFLLVTKDGILYSVSINCDSPEKVELDVEKMAEFHTSVKIAAFMEDVLLLNGEKLILYDLNDPDYDLSCDGLKLKAIYPSSDEQFIGLTVEGKLIAICATTLQVIALETPDLYDNFLFYNSDEKMAFASCRIDGVEYAKLLNITENMEVFSLKLDNSVQLVTSPGAYDEQLVITKHSDSELRILMIMETIPEKRLERMLKKRMYDEAEAFAEQYNLGTEPIKQARILSFIDSPLQDAERTAELIRMLDDITDVDFKLQICLSVSCDTQESMEEVLKYGLGLDCKKINKTEEIEDLFSQVTELMHKFNTFLMVMNLKWEAFDPDNWHEFNTSNLYQYFLQELKHKNIEVASIMFSRIDDATFEELSDTDISYILDILEKQAMPFYSSFLHTFIPIIMNRMPASLPQLVKWICDRVFYIEKNAFDDFPDNANFFMNQMALLLNINPFSNGHLAEYRVEFEKDLEWMSYMMQCLETIQEFKDNFKLLIPLQDCLKGPVSLVEALLSMDSIEVSDKLMDFLVQFLVKNNFEPNLIFVNVIQGLIAYDQKYWINAIFPIWEKISSVEKKLTTLMLILKNGNLPWCETIRNMCKRALSFEHELVPQIKTSLEMEPVYIVLSKYGLKSAKTENLTDMWAVNRVIYLNGIEDAYTLCLNQTMRINTTIILLQKFIRKEDSLAALGIFSNLTTEDIIDIIPNFYHFLQVILEEQNSLWKLEHIETAMEIGKVLLGKSSMLMKNEFKHCCNENYFQKLNIIHTLNKSYNVHVTVKDLTNKQDYIIDEIIMSNILEDYNTKKHTTAETILLCRKYEEMLGMRNCEILVRICEKVSDAGLLLAVLTTLYESLNDPGQMVRVVFIVLNKFKSEEIDFPVNGENHMDESEDEMFAVGPSGNFEEIKECVLMCNVLAGRAILLEPSEEAYMALHWSDTFSFIKNTGRDNVIVFSMSSIENICNFFVMFMKIAACTKGKEWKYNSLLNKAESLNEETLLKQVETMIPIYLERISSDSNNVIACRVLQCSIFNLTLLDFANTNLKQLLLMYFFQRVKYLLENIFSVEKIDVELAFTLLTLSTCDKAVRIIKRALKVYTYMPEKATVISRLGLRICNYYDDAKEKEFFVKIITLECWWKTNETWAVSQSVSKKDFFCMPKGKLLENLIEGGVPLGDVEKFCEDFKLDLQCYYNYFLLNMLSNWKPDYSVVVNKKDERCLHVKNDENQLYNRCQEVIDLIDDKENIVTALNELWEKINFYNYEVFMCILNILKLLKNEKCSKGVLLLFLKGYRRENKPSRVENEEWFTKWPDTQKLDPISEWRLPFTPTLFSNNVWNILRPEVNIDNFKKWFHVLPLLTHLKKDEICSYAVKDMVSRLQTESNQNSDEWLLHSQFEALLTKADSCIQNIENLEMATSVSYHLMTHIPKGADQVMAAKISYNYAKVYKNSPSFKDTPENERVIVKLQKKFYSYSTVHILHANKLAKPEYLELVNQPNDLIKALYSDDRIIKSTNSIIYNCPDINKAVDEIAKLYKIDIQKKRVAILEDCLNDSCIDTEATLDESILLLPVVNNSNDSEVHLKKAIYICQSDNVEFWREYLYSKGFQEDLSKYFYQARAMKCYCAITPKNIIEQNPELTHKDILNFIDKILLLHDLKCLGMTVSYDSITEHKCKGLLKTVSKNANRPQILKVMVNICTFYEIFDIKYWELIITNMITLKWYKELKFYITLLKMKKCTIIYKEFYVKGWQTVIEYSINSLMAKDQDLENRCIENMQLIQSCPVLNKINLKNVFIKYEQMKQLGYAVLLLQYFPFEQRKEMWNSLLNNHNAKSVKASVSKLPPGLVGMNYVMKYMQNLSD